ncbi:hypothetical protein ACIBD9_04010 [Micromonospora sp. NPDC050784]|uniref:hypothetical protein n=1 Tax=Micromonospora sp. NPDC050784 TaxID=3364281 RepID=UPI0037B69FD7
MRMPREWTRWAELRGASKRLKQLSLRRVPVMSGEKELRSRVRRHLAESARYGIDADVIKAIDEVIESHVIEMEAEILRSHTAEEVELGKLQGTIDGLIVQYDYDGEARGGRIKQLDYQQRMALRDVEDRDTPTPAGYDGVEEPGHQVGKVGELAGRSLLGLLVLYLVLALAMVADLITFRQVVERMLNDALVFPLVLALTVTTTYVAHWAGEGFKQAKEQRRNIRRAVAGWSLFGVWLAMGFGAFVFRLLAPALPSADATGAYVNAGTSATASTDGNPLLSAGLMLLLYVLTGAIAFTAGYRRPRPEVGQFTRAGRRLRRANPRQGVLLRDVAEARALGRQLDDLRNSRKRQYAVEVDRCKSAARRVRAEAAMRAVQQRIAAERPRWRRLLPGATRLAAIAAPQEQQVRPEDDEPSNS